MAVAFIQLGSMRNGEPNPACARRYRRLIIGPMDRATAIQQIRAACNALSTGVTGIHPLVPALADQPTQDEIFKALYELTKQVETVKKQLLKLERRDDSGAL